MNLNRLEVEGLLGSDGELKYTQSGTAILSTSLAWNDYRDGKAGPTTWFKINVWGKYAEALRGQVRKGMKVLVIGRCELRTYEKRDGGQGFSLEVSAEQIKFLVKPESKQTQGDGSGYDSDAFREPAGF